MEGASADPAGATNLLVFLGMIPLGGGPAYLAGATNLLVILGMIPLGGGPADPLGVTNLLVSDGVTPVGGNSAGPDGKVILNGNDSNENRKIPLGGGARGPKIGVIGKLTRGEIAFVEG